MASVVPTTSVENVALVKATAPRYFKKASDLTFRRRLWLALLQRYGRIEANATSFSCVWDVEYAQPTVRQYGDSGDLDFSEADALNQFNVGVRGYTATDKLSEKQRLMNAGPEQIDDLYKNKSLRLSKRIRQVLCGELYIDGDATGNTNRFNGIENFFANDGATVAADKVASPSDTYAGQSTALAQGGNWSTNLTTSPNATVATDWPEGNGDCEYDWSSPLILNYVSTSWAATTKTWPNTCEEVMRYGRVVQVARGAKGDDQRVPYVHMLSTTLYTQFLELYAARNRQIVPHREADNLGFGDTVNFEGDMVHYEFDCPAGVGYGISPVMMELFHLGSQLINSYGPEWAITKLGYLYLAYVFGNLRFVSPKFFCKYQAVQA